MNPVALGALEKLGETWEEELPAIRGMGRGVVRDIFV